MKQSSGVAKNSCSIHPQIILSRAVLLSLIPEDNEAESKALTQKLPLPQGVFRNSSLTRSRSVWPEDEDKMHGFIWQRAMDLPSPRIFSSAI